MKYICQECEFEATTYNDAEQHLIAHPSHAITIVGHGIDGAEDVTMRLTND